MGPYTPKPRGGDPGLREDLVSAGGGNSPPFKQTPSKGKRLSVDQRGNLHSALERERRRLERDAPTSPRLRPTLSTRPPDFETAAISRGKVIASRIAKGRK